MFQVEITLRHLVSHLSGIRHYEKVPSPVDNSLTSPSNSDTEHKTSDGKENKKDEFENQEYLLNRYFPSVSNSLVLFQEDELFSKPGILNVFVTYELFSAILHFFLILKKVQNSFIQHMGGP